MLQQNSDRIMMMLQPTDVVLDIGGWAHPFNRANYIMDCQPYETRGYYNRTFMRFNPLPSIGGTVECFTKDRWIERDICNHEPFPFADKSLDFVICSHTLEDIRDPIWVCSEMVRIAKAGYIEIPSRLSESCRGLEPGITGTSHHRWLIDIDQDRSEITFLMKYHTIHRWRCSLPPSVLRRLSPEQRVSWLFWNDRFTFRERFIYGDQAQVTELESFVDSVRPYSRWRKNAGDNWESVRSFARRIFVKAHTAFSSVDVNR